MFWNLFFVFFFFVYVVSQDTYDTQNNTLPVVLWHGLGDSYDSQGMREIVDILSNLLNTYVHSIYLDKHSLNDKNSGFFGNVNDQVAFVSQQLSSIDELKYGFNAIGFSQGGLFLRAYIERYNRPKVVNFITFGTPHNGISDFYCPPGVIICKAANYFVKHGLWSQWVRDNIVPIQYYRDLENMDDYSKHNSFLNDINNEKEVKNGTYARNMASLKKFVMVEFSNDLLIIPKGSCSFNSYNKSADEIIYLRNTMMYLDDWIGLKQLDEKNALVQMTIPGGHMEIDYSVFVYIIKKYFIGSNESENTVQWQSDDTY
ncbi:hypothetical protein PORY_001346 [Pneumocystis oryctolagi]|uniref:Uncharacterized protein n=1 Tax=Pneumocystis oryctolagi TaxID=42067 RepID=A0ACB7CBQ2_9ASCO|nr:hypothetical protein PORY_001346 [Pneumocystis oryctolagi]